MSGEQTRKWPQSLYADKVVLAPMVRENSLPFRLLCLKYGADLVYTEELIDHRLSECRRVENTLLKTIDFVDKHDKVMLRTCPSEKQRLVLQIGSNDPERALKTAKLVGADVSGIDFNFGCPKSFSLSGGMGAALLEKPDQIEALLKTCVENLPPELPVTCKIRILPDLNRTLELVRRIENCGVAAIAVHGRTKDQRPGHENQNDVLRTISYNLRSIPLIANGDSNNIKSHEDILRFKRETGASSVMIARAAMRNPSIFKRDGKLEPIENVIREFLASAIKAENLVANTKYCLQTMLTAGHFGADFIKRFHAAKDNETLCDLFELDCGVACERS